MIIYKHTYNFETKELTTKKYQATQQGAILTVQIPNEPDRRIEYFRLNNTCLVPKKSWAAMDRGECGEVFIFSKSSDLGCFVQAIREYCQVNISTAEKSLNKAQREYNKTKENMEAHMKVLDELAINKDAQEEIV